MNGEFSDTRIVTLGPAAIPSPLTLADRVTRARTFVEENQRVAIDIDPVRLQAMIKGGQAIPSLWNLGGPGPGPFLTFGFPRLRFQIGAALVQPLAGGTSWPRGLGNGHSIPGGPVGCLGKL